ncbi:hypothetical protein D3C80_1228050 [compost metagenome]
MIIHIDLTAVVNCKSCIFQAQSIGVWFTTDSYQAVVSFQGNFFILFVQSSQFHTFSGVFNFLNFMLQMEFESFFFQDFSQLFS